jgi:hypothetical protein
VVYLVFSPNGEESEIMRAAPIRMKLLSYLTVFQAFHPHLIGIFHSPFIFFFYVLMSFNVFFVIERLLVFFVALINHSKIKIGMQD